jgi:hypothetical protein
MPRLTVEFSEEELAHLLEEGHRHDRSAAEQVQALVQRSLALASVMADARAPTRTAAACRGHERLAAEPAPALVERDSPRPVSDSPQPGIGPDAWLYLGSP